VIRAQQLADDEKTEALAPPLSDVRVAAGAPEAGAPAPFIAGRDRNCAVAGDASAPNVGAPLTQSAAFPAVGRFVPAVAAEETMTPAASSAKPRVATNRDQPGYFSEQ